MPRKRAERPVVHAAQPQPAVEGSPVYRPGAPVPRSHPVPDAGEADVTDGLLTAAAALCLSPDDFARDAVALLAHAGPAAYLRFLRDKDPAAWRARVMAVFQAEDGNASAVARRLGLARTGIAWLLRQDPELARAVDVQWPGRQRNSD